MLGLPCQLGGAFQGMSDSTVVQPLMTRDVTVKMARAQSARRIEGRCVLVWSVVIRGAVAKSRLIEDDVADFNFGLLPVRHDVTDSEAVVAVELA